MRILISFVVWVLSFSANGTELIIFNKQWIPSGDCQLVASDVKYGYKTHMRCGSGKSSIEIYFDQECPLKTLVTAGKKQGNSISLYTMGGVDYEIYRLLNLNSKKYETIRVIKDNMHCAISFYDSPNIERSPLEGLWRVKN